MNKFTIMLTIMLICTVIGYSQVAINTDGSDPDSSAILDLKSTNSGLLLPRLTNVQRDALNAPAEGLFIYNTDEHVIQFYDGILWRYLYRASCAPQQPSAITGNDYPDCNQTGLTYSTTEVAGATNYHWIVPTDATIVSGQGTTEIMVDMGTQSGNVNVRAESGCGNSAYKNLPITIGIPSQPNSITGNAYPECGVTAMPYSIDAVNGALNYTWMVPSDATIVSGQDTPSITVDFGANSGNVSVRAENSCGNSNYTDLAISIGVPSQPGSIVGTILPEPNAAGETYSINAVNGATSYHWTVPAGAVITNGQGTTNITVDFDTIAGNVSVRAENACGNSNYINLAITFFACGDQYTDTRDGKVYNTVSIGSQCWFAENLNIGTRIDGSGNQTNNGTIEKYCYNNHTASCDVYGGLYQWNEMMQYVTNEGTQGICPTGWHLPTDAEWMTLEEEVESTTGVNWNTSGFRGTDAGGNLKETGISHWNSPNTGATNTSGFTGLPGGYRNTNGTFYNTCNGAYFWSSNMLDSHAWTRDLYYNNAQVHRDYYEQTYGFSVRCVRD